MNRVKVVILPSQEKVIAQGDCKAAFGLNLRLEHPETGEHLGCRDVHLSFPMDDCVTATAEFIVSEIVVEPHA